VKILDKQRYWSFIKAYFICYVSLVGLYVVIDAFSNVDEFSKRADGAVEMFQIMSRYYLVHQSQFFDQLCGVIGMMAAIFTVTWMQRNNEQLAMLAAGVSTHRAIVPVLVSSIIVSVLSVYNQESIIPYFGEELARRHDDDGKERVNSVAIRIDSNENVIHAKQADRATRTIMPFFCTIDKGNYGSILELDGQQATYIPPDHPTAPYKGGWLVREATINPPVNDDLLEERGGILFRVTDDKDFPPPLAIVGKSDPSDPSGADDADGGPPAVLTPHSEIAYLASMPPLPLCLSFETWRMHALLDRRLEFGRCTYFLKSSVTFQAMTRKANWQNFATTSELLESLSDPSTGSGSEAIEVAIFLHSRLLRPFLSLSLLFMSLPLVLGGYGRNMFINLGFALGNSAIFYGALLFTQYLGTFLIVSPAMTVWAPLMVFGVIASLRWGQIRT
jgi:lipopolysaccharide export system permease protein